MTIDTEWNEELLSSVVRLSTVWEGILYDQDKIVFVNGIYLLNNIFVFLSLPSTVVLPALLFRLPGFDLPVFQRGFFCKDETISYPYKDSTVPSSVLYGVGIGVFAVIVSETS